MVGKSGERIYENHGARTGTERPDIRHSKALVAQLSPRPCPLGPQGRRHSVDGVWIPCSTGAKAQGLTGTPRGLLTCGPQVIDPRLRPAGYFNVVNL